MTHAGNITIATHAPNLMAQDIHDITADSRAVLKGSLFVAIKGVHHDGTAYIDEAIKKGAGCILASSIPAHLKESSIPFLLSDAPARTFAQMTAHLHAPLPSLIAGVTGTNGKTSVVDMTRQLLELLGFATASIGTMGLTHKKTIDEHVTKKMTTPDALTLARILAKLKKQNTNRVVMEASSHGLAQHRLDGISFCAAAFTNLTHDHLDYHASLKDYYRAKERLFTECLQDGGFAVINGDSQAGKNIIAQLRGKKKNLLTYGEQKTADIHLAYLYESKDGLHGEIICLGQKYEFDLPLHGMVQGHNLCAVLGLLYGMGVSFDASLSKLPYLRPVRGRMEKISEAVYVDYAHTPDALARSLSSLHPLVQNKLWLVFGCGGERDQEKRPLMGQIAEQYADKIIITDDNPRHENSAHIRQAIAQGMKKNKHEMIESRREAIGYALAAMQEGDTLLIAGKGHEHEQIIGDKRLPFDDKEVVLQFLKKGGAHVVE